MRIITNRIAEWFTPRDNQPTQQTELDQYLANKHVTSIAELEHHMREYERKIQKHAYNY